MDRSCYVDALTFEAAELKHDSFYWLVGTAFFASFTTTCAILEGFFHPQFVSQVLYLCTLTVLHYSLSCLLLLLAKLLKANYQTDSVF